MRRTICCAVSSISLLLLAGCSRTELPKDPLEARAQQFVTLALQLGMHDRTEVDAYFGPAEIDPRTESKPPPLEELRVSTAKLLKDAEQNPPPSAQVDRARALEEQLRYFEALLQLLTTQTRMPFDEEAKRVYGIDAGAYDESSLASERVKQLDELLSGTGPVPFRVAKYRNQFVVPADKREKIFARAMEECRKRTLAHWKLPDDERLEVQFTREVGAAWHKYEGGHRSTLKVNPVAIAYLGQMIDVACHEGYPGHHAQFLVMESDAGASGLPLELTVALMRSPANVLREGAANYGVDLAFPADERLAFERDVLFPMAGFPVAEVERFEKVHRLVSELALSVLPILREYRDGVISFNTATFRLEREAFIASPAALLKFVDDLGAYSTGYTVARNAVRNHVESAARGGENPWVVLRRVVAGPQTSVLRAQAPATSVGLTRGIVP